MKDVESHLKEFSSISLLSLYLELIISFRKFQVWFIWHSHCQCRHLKPFYWFSFKSLDCLHSRGAIHTKIIQICFSIVDMPSVCRHPSHNHEETAILTSQFTPQSSISARLVTFLVLATAIQSSWMSDGHFLQHSVNKSWDIHCVLMIYRRFEPFWVASLAPLISYTYVFL